MADSRSRVFEYGLGHIVDVLSRVYDYLFWLSLATRTLVVRVRFAGELRR